ncbi:hypothetical protein PFISCL1PPCAC_9954 [Pristionchus fissidentatus]|uniref:Apoptosis regulator Bcl-2 family BH4 domain-containing protein n=1 Tax=Pristionchus fissidentatus TaxID=1538716 RepID=A0AAV5VKP4_9BILA|nr:hypothetical protein PFISCL1PPCAC_9954 [Pristionchus fissidentatus]
MTQQEYEHDWEDPRLAVEGFVTDYIVWRLARDNLEWYEAPDIPENAEIEHQAMRDMCVVFESRNSNDLIVLSDDLKSDSLTYARFCEVVEEFGKSATDIPSEMTYGRMVGLITFAGLICVDKARNNERRDIGLVALYTSKFIESRIKLTWVDSMRSWSLFLDMHRQVVARLSSSRAPSRPSVPSAPSSSSSRRHSLLPSRRSSLILAAVSIVGVGAIVAGRALMKGH